MVLVIAYNLRKQPENVIIQVKMLACKGIFTPSFNRNGGFVKAKPQATKVADKISFCHVSML